MTTGTGLLRPRWSDSVPELSSGSISLTRTNNSRIATTAVAAAPGTPKRAAPRESERRTSAEDAAGTADCLADPPGETEQHPHDGEATVEGQAP